MGLTLNVLWCILLVRATTVITAQEQPHNGGQPPNPFSNDNIPSNFNTGFPPKTNVESQLNAPPPSFPNSAGLNGQNYPNSFFGQGFGPSGQFQNLFGPQQSSNEPQYSESFKFGQPGLQQIQNQFGRPHQQQNRLNQIPNPNGPSSFQSNPAASNGQLSSEYFKFGSPSQQQQMQLTSPRLSSQYGPTGLGASFGSGSQHVSGPQMGTSFGATGQQMGGHHPFRVSGTQGQTNQKSGEGFLLPNYQMSGTGNLISSGQMMQRAGEQTPSNYNLMSNGGESMPPRQMMDNPIGAMFQNQMSSGGGFMSPSPPNFQMPGSGSFGPQIPPNNLMSNSGGFQASNPLMPPGAMPSFASVASAIIPSLMYMTTPGILFPSPPMYMQNPLNFNGQGPQLPQFPFGQPGGMNGREGFNTMQRTPGSGFNFQQPFNAMPSGSGFNFQQPFNGQPGPNPGFPRPQMFPLGGQMSQMFKPYKRQDGVQNSIEAGSGPNHCYCILQNNGNYEDEAKKYHKPQGALQTGSSNNNLERRASSINGSPTEPALQDIQPGTGPNNAVLNSVIRGTGQEQCHCIININGDYEQKRARQTGNNNNNLEGMAPSINVTGTALRGVRGAPNRFVGGTGPNHCYCIVQNHGSYETQTVKGNHNNDGAGCYCSINGETALQGVQPVQVIAPDVNSFKDSQNIPSTAATIHLNQTGAPSSGALQIDAPPKDETNQGMSGGVETTSEGGKPVATERDGIPDDLVVTNEEISNQGPSGVSNGHGSMSAGETSTGQGNIGGGANIAAVPSSHQIQEGKNSGRLQGSTSQNGGSLNQSGLTAIEGGNDASLMVGEGGLAAGGGQLAAGGGQLGQWGVGGGDSASSGGSLAGGMERQTGGPHIKLVTVPAKKTQNIRLQTVGSPGMTQTLQTVGSPAMKQGGASHIKLITLPAQGQFMQQHGMQTGGGSTSEGTNIKMYSGNGNTGRLSKYQMYPNSFLVTPIKTKLPRPMTSSHGIINEGFSMEDIMNHHTMDNQKQTTNTY
uniref:Uncharacterized protein n=1 Tax=Cacopsylla melanoneura TaxID=428564 RepID=A0A8D8S0A2_9HEMI